MDRVNRNNCDYKMMPGRTGAHAFGKDGYVKEDECSMGFVTFAPVYGKMEPHKHRPEVLYVEDCKNAFVRYGKSEDNLDGCDPLEAGDVLLMGEDDWHTFDFGSDDGFVRFVTFLNAEK